MKRALGFGILAAFLVATGARAEDGGTAATPASPGTASKPLPAVSTSDETARATPGVVVAIDPSTGKLRAPTPEERRALAEDARRGLPLVLRPSAIETLPDGRKRATLGPEFFRWSVVRRTAGGNLVLDCVTKPDLPSAPAESSVPAPAER